jgi:hypothetical protein
MNQPELQKFMPPNGNLLFTGCSSTTAKRFE